MRFRSTGRPIVGPSAGAVQRRCSAKEGVDNVHTVVCFIQGREDLDPVSGLAINLSITVPERGSASAT